MEVSPLGDLTIHKIESAEKSQKIHEEDTPEKNLSKQLSQASLSSVDKLVIGYEARSALQEMELKLFEDSREPEDLTRQANQETTRSEPIPKDTTKRLQTLDEDSDMDTDELISSQLEKNGGTKDSNAELTDRTISQREQDLEDALKLHERRIKEKKQTESDGASDSSQIELKNEQV